MLRIKEGIDLKELKKYGFKKTKKYYELLHVWYPLGDSVPCYKTSINVRIDNRHIYTYIEELTWQGQKDYHSFDFQDILYDLIKADMVEKI